MTDYQKYNLWISAVGTMLTFAVVIAAIWGERIRQYLSKPRLRIKLHDPTFTTLNNGQKAWYYHLQISNDRPSSPARNVRVLLTHVYNQGPDGSWVESNWTSPSQVLWRWHGNRPLYSTIGPEEFSPFARLLENSKEIELQLYSYPNNLHRSIRSKSPRRLTFKAVSDTTASESLTIDVAWDGKWVEGLTEMRTHLVIKEAVV